MSTIVHPTVSSAIGRTPMVRLERVVEPDMAEVWVKMEGMNPGGSLKDRTALGMVVDAEQRGLLAPSGTIVEPTSGNTGVGLAQVAAARGRHLREPHAGIARRRLDDRPTRREQSPLLGIHHHA